MFADRAVGPILFDLWKETHKFINYLFRWTKSVAREESAEEWLLLREPLEEYKRALTSVLGL
jgi:hypothetical protein